MKLWHPSASVGLALAMAITPAHAEKKAPATPHTPNILLIVMDDVGIDQMKTFGYGGDSPPATPNIENIADAGIRFRNAWAMPACTTSRAVMYDARFPFRTNVLGALGPDDLANSMVSPYEVTTPKLLATRGYDSALFGKSHTTLQGHDPAGLAGPHVLGWNYFAGWLDETGDPASIDVTAGGVASPGKIYPCGYVPSSKVGGADSGACYMADGSCSELTTEGGVPPGRICRDRGGILDPDKSCAVPMPAYVDFSLLSGHYVSPVTYNQPDGRVDDIPSTDPRARQFRADFVVDEAVRWINSRPKNKPWIASVNFASDHTPLMQPPYDAPVEGNAASSDMNCLAPQAQQPLSDMLIESMDGEIGRLLVDTGLARRDKNGGLVYQPHATDTMVIILGDNGSLGATVKTPFNVVRSKGTAYQTGVWVPLIVSGPLMRGPARSNSHMINVADLYSLFGEIAGIDDVQAEVPRPLDSERMLPYIINPKQKAIRKFNFTQVGVNLQANGSINGPCTISGTCTQIPVTKGVCEDNGGIWWGKGHDPSITHNPDPDGFKLCCEVNKFVIDQGCDPQAPGCPYGITPLVSIGIRDKHFKIVKNSVTSYVSQEEPCRDDTQTEFYTIDEAAPAPDLDDPGDDLLTGVLTPRQQASYDALSAKLTELLASEPACPGDGNIDYVVDQDDLDGWSQYSQAGQSSVFDFTLDGLTDGDDQAVIQANLGTDCRLP